MEPSKDASPGFWYVLPLSIAAFSVAATTAVAFCSVPPGQSSSIEGFGEVHLYKACADCMFRHRRPCDSSDSGLEPGHASFRVSGVG